MAWTQKHPVPGALYQTTPTGSEISGAEWQSEIVAAINGPITHLFTVKGKKVQ